MFKKAIISALLVLATTSAAWAQSPKVEVAGLFGYSLTDGVSGDPYKAADGNIYDRIDPKDSMAFGLSFLFPVQLVFLELVGVLTSRRLRSWRRYAILGIAIFAAVITPSSDPYTMLAMMIPMYLFYEAAIIIGLLLKK